jgi:hypothetical protein
MTGFDVGPIPEDAHARLIHLSNAFGRLLFETVRASTREAATSIPDTRQTQLDELLDAQLYAVLQLIDGVTVPIGNDRIRVEFVLKARLRERENDKVIEEVELGPDGEGLCMGYHGWVDGDFGGRARAAEIKTTALAWYTHKEP